MLSACSNLAPEGPGDAAMTARSPAPATPPAKAANGVATAQPSLESGALALLRPHARWAAASWPELPAWNADRAAAFWPAFMKSCERPAAGWQAACAAARLSGLGPAPTDDAAVRAWLEQQLRPWRVEALDKLGDKPGDKPADKDATGLATGYFEPLVEASRVPTSQFRFALHAAPADLATKKPYWTRRELELLPAAQKSVRGAELAWVKDRLDVLVLQIQGSGRLTFVARDGAATKVVRVAYAAHNDQPYQSVGRWLIDQGELRASEASWPAIRSWAKANPKRVDELLWSNPRVVFFREEPLPDASVGPRGAQGVPLTPGRSVAVDPLSVPYGTPVWLDTTEPLSTTPLRRLVVAQDTGTAITGAVRADYFWGWGEEAEAQAGRMKQPLRMWVLWPR